MSFYHELHLYMIDNNKEMLIDDGKNHFSENSLHRVMPKHIKKAGNRYKQMCGCQCCVICKDTSQELKKVRIKIYCIKKYLLDLDPI
jgi:hypothetical protein